MKRRQLFRFEFEKDSKDPSPNLDGILEKRGISKGRYDPDVKKKEAAAAALLNTPPPAVSPTSARDSYLRQLAAALIVQGGVKLFALRDVNHKRVCDPEGHELYFNTKSMARATRDDLQIRFDYTTYVTEGPDHSGYVHS